MGPLFFVIMISMHNAADVPEAELQQAQAQVERIFATADVTVRWGESPLQVIVRRQPGGGPGSATPAALGTTVGDDRARGGNAFVFYDRVLRIAHQYRQPVDVILALAMAHEIGHLLLPAPAHSATGLMKADWSGDDVRHLTTGGEPFSARQRTLLAAQCQGQD